MRSKLLETRGEKAFVLVFDTGDEVIETLTGFAKLHKLSAAKFTAIGAFRAATLGYYDLDKQDYMHIPVHEQVEVLSMIGDVALDKGEPKVHAHVVVGRRDGGTVGGHLLEGHVRPTLELMLEESPAELRRQFDAESGLPLIRIDGEK